MTKKVIKFLANNKDVGTAEYSFDTVVMLCNHPDIKDIQIVDDKAGLEDWIKKEKRKLTTTTRIYYADYDTDGMIIFDWIKKMMVISVLIDCLWVQDKAAAVLGISGRAINYYIDRYGIKHERWRKHMYIPPGKETEDGGDEELQAMQEEDSSERRKSA
jgi:hypothetical protein